MTLPSEALKQRILRAKPYLSCYFESLSQPCQFALRKSEIPNYSAPFVFYRTPQDFRCLSSRYDPHKEVQRMLVNVRANAQGGEIVVIKGLATLGILTELPRLLRKNQICLAIDAFYELGQLLCQHSSLMQEFLLRPGCHLFCGVELRPLLQQYLESLPIENLSGLQNLVNPASVRLAPEFYKETEGMLATIIKSRMSDLLTRLEFESCWVKNSIINSHYIPPRNHPHTKYYTTRAYKDKLKKIPGVLVASGPSLQESLSELKLLQKKAFILCVDTSLKVLLQAGITPHAVITLDAQPHTLFAFQGIKLKDILLFSDLAANPAILRNVEARAVIFSATAQVSCNFQGEIHQEFTAGTEFAQSVHGSIGYLQSGGSVATSGLDLLRTLGCDPILLFGLDQAYTDRKIHSNSTYHTQRWLTNVSRTLTLGGIIEKIVRKRKTLLVPSLDGGEILSDHVLTLYKRWFENTLTTYTQKVWQLSPRGAELKSAKTTQEPMSFISSLPDLCKSKKMLPNGILDVFSQAPKLSFFSHSLSSELMDDLRQATQKKMELTTLYKSFPFLEFAKRKADLYIKRNKDKLDSKQANLILQKRSLAALKRLERGIRPFVQEQNL